MSAKNVLSPTGVVNSGDTKSRIKIDSTKKINIESPMDNILKKLAGMKPTDELTPAKQQSLVACAINYGGAFICLIIVAIAVYIASTDDDALTKNFTTYMFFMVLPILIGAYLIMPAFKMKVSATTLIVNAFIFLIVVVSLYVFYKNKDPASMMLLQYGIYAIAFLSIIVGLALLLKFSDRYVYNSRGWYGVIWQVIMFLPCLLVDFIEYIKAELQITPNTVYVLLAFEVLLLLAFFGIPKLIDASKSTTSTTLLKQPVFLNRPIQIADYKVLAVNAPSTSPFLEMVRYRNNYSLSFWAYLNPTGTGKLPLLKMGTKSDSGGKPLVEYANGKYVFTLTNAGTAPPSYEVVLPSQKWNFFVITYNDYSVDLFVNGNLEKTYELKTDTLPTYGPGDIIEIGYNSDNKRAGSIYSGTLSGAICNVKYHKTVIPQREITTEYNLLVFNNPPVN